MKLCTSKWGKADGTRKQQQRGFISLFSPSPLVFDDNAARARVPPRASTNTYTQNAHRKEIDAGTIVTFILSPSNPQRADSIVVLTEQFDDGRQMGSTPPRASSEIGRAARRRRSQRCGNFVFIRDRREVLPHFIVFRLYIGPPTFDC